MLTPATEPPGYCAAVSQENVEVVRRGIEAFARASWTESLQWMDPEVEWHDSPDLPGAQVYRGHEGVLAQWRGMSEALEDFTVDAERFFDAGDRVVVFLRSRGRGRVSGIEVSRELAQVYTVEHGRVIHVVGYDDRAKALEVVDLAEQDGP
jgi:ketosteroid isomerase-like protein